MKGFVYFIRPIGMAGPIKIGHSAEPRARILTLSTWSPFPLEIITTIPGGRDLECNVHDCFANLHSHREWFHAGKDLLLFIEKLKEGVPVEQAVDLSQRRGSIKAKMRSVKPDDALCSRYNLRISAACRKAERRLDNVNIVSPPDWVNAIMFPWSGIHQFASKVRGPKPSDQDIAELERFLADPVTLGHRHPPYQPPAARTA